MIQRLKEAKASQPRESKASQLGESNSKLASFAKTRHNSSVNFRSLLLLFCTVCSFQAVQARKSDFTESHTGLYSGAGTYFHPLPNDNLFDPVVGASPATATITNSKSTYLLPMRLGIFKDSPRGNFMVYGIYMINLLSSWTVAGTPEGTGTSIFSSYGIGAEAGIPIQNSSHFRLLLVLNGEYLKQRVQLKYLPSTGGTSLLDLNVPSYLVGVGIRPEVWLGDSYALSIFAGYQYGLVQKWNVGAETAFMDNVLAAGKLLNPTSGSEVSAQFGGIFVAAALKLHFQ